MSEPSPDSLQAELERVHLPMLDEAGFVDWDPETGTVSKGERFEQIEPMLDEVSDG